MDNVFNDLSISSLHYQQLKSKADLSWVLDEKKEKWKTPNSWKRILFCFSLFLAFSSPLVSCQKGDRILVTQSDYQALKAIKHDIIDFKGVLRSWNDSSYGACSGKWIGIKCVNGQVIAIQLPFKGLGGKISEKIGQLQALRRISLHDNALSGQIPISLGFLPNLRGIYLFNNRLSGSIPPIIGNIPVLQTLDLSNNHLSGTIPPSLSKSTRIYRLNLSFNALSGKIPLSLTQAPSLTFLALQHNNLSGLIPDNWGFSRPNISGSYQLQSLSLDHNFLSGKIPISLSKLGSLQEINLSHNQINGIIPDELGSSLSKLKVLDFSNNGINGSFPTTFSNLSSLVSLNLSNNHLDSNIPNSLSNLHNLTSFDVSYNNLSGVVPIDLSKKFNSSSFVGNIQLCGYSSSTQCPSSPPPPPPLQHRRRRRLSTKDIILIAAGILLLLLLLLCCVLLFCLIGKKAVSKAKNGKKEGTLGSTSKIPTAGGGAEVESGGEAGGKLVHFDGPFVFAADDLLCATAEIMGKSTYGTAYKATLEDGNQVAVKRLREKITKGQKEFEIEVAQLGMIRNPNILALRAYYLGPKGEKLLVYDYMPNGSLASFLHARGPETTIAWPTRMKIIIGITRGICFLHTNEENIIIHGNLTSTNILLDEQYNPKIADVGLSRLMTTAGNTNVIATAGTMGYRAPELSKLKNASTKTDIYSLGVIILELLTGKSPSETTTDGLDLPQWVASIVKEEWTNEVFDVELMRKDASNNIIGDELLNTLKLALHCVDPSPEARPDSDQVLQKFEEIIKPQTEN